MSPTHRTPRPRLALAWLAVCLAVAAILLPLLVGCGNADPFAGVYWEPSTGRRFEIKKDGDAYVLYYGRDLRPYAAKRAGDQLTVTDAMGGRTVVRQGDVEGELELVTGGKATVLRPLPEHQ